METTLKFQNQVKNNRDKFGLPSFKEEWQPNNFFNAWQSIIQQEKEFSATHDIFTVDMENKHLHWTNIEAIFNIALIEFHEAFGKIKEKDKIAFISAELAGIDLKMLPIRQKLNSFYLFDKWGEKELSIFEAYKVWLVSQYQSLQLLPKVENKNKLNKNGDVPIIALKGEIKKANTKIKNLHKRLTAANYIKCDENDFLGLFGKKRIDSVPKPVILNENKTQVSLFYIIFKLLEEYTSMNTPDTFSTIIEKSFKKENGEEFKNVKVYYSPLKTFFANSKKTNDKIKRNIPSADTMKEINIIINSIMY